MKTAPQPSKQIELSNLLEVIATRHRAPWLLRHQDNFSGPHKELIESKLAISQGDIQILEEVAFLCAYQPFVQDVQTFRSELSKRLKIELPVSEAKAGQDALATVYLKERVFYWRTVQNLLSKYRLTYSLYWPKNWSFEWNEGIKGEYRLREGLSERRAEGIVARKTLEEQGRSKTILENILFFNNPYPSDVIPGWLPMDLLREERQDVNSGFRFRMEFDTPFIEVRFPLYATLPEMAKSIKREYKSIQKARSERAPVPSRKDRRKEKLSLLLEAYRLHEQGLNEEAIAECLDRMENRTGTDVKDFRKRTSVLRLIERAQHEMKLRFAKNK